MRKMRVKSLKRTSTESFNNTTQQDGERISGLEDKIFEIIWKK